MKFTPNWREKIYVFLRVQKLSYKWRYYTRVASVVLGGEFTVSITKTETLRVY